MCTWYMYILMFLNFSYIFQLFSLYEDFLAKNAKYPDTGSPGGDIGRGLRAIRALWSAWRALKVILSGRSGLDDFSCSSKRCLILYARTGKMSSAFCPFTSTHPRHVPGRQQTTRQKAQRYSAYNDQQATPCVWHTDLRYTDVSSCLYRNRPSVFHHLPIPAAVCDKPTHTLDGNVRTVWIEYEYLNCPYKSNVLRLDIRQRAQNTNNITTPPNSTSSSGPHHAHVPGPWSTAMVMVASSEAAVRRLSSPPLSLLLCCCACVCAPPKY